MDTSAVVHAPEAALEDLGLVRAGDRLNLISFCKNETPMKDKAEKRRALLETFLSSKKDKRLKTNPKGETSSQGCKDNMKSKKIQLGWKHYKDEEDKYVLVPLSKGGGSRFVTVSQTMGKRELMNLCKETFFPDGVSQYGKATDMLMDLANFKNEKIESTIFVNKAELPFNVANYMEAYKIKNVRLYLRTKEMFSFEDEIEDDLPVLPFIQIDDDDDGETGAPLKEIDSSLLIGTSEERNQILEEQNHEYSMSLNADIAKEEKQQIKKRVQDARLSRINPEPLQDYVTVKVRHPLLGITSRRFKAHSLMSSVYDWAGSLNPDPVDFTLNDPFGVVLPPSMEVADRCTLTMMESLVGTPSLNSSDDEVNFLGFGQALNSMASDSSVLYGLVGNHSGTGLLEDMP